MTKDEEQLMGLVKEYARASCLMAEYAGSKEEEGEYRAEQLTAGQAILAMYRSALSKSAPVFEGTRFYLDDKGNKWVEDPNGTHGWWSAEPGSTDDEGAPFQPWRGRDGIHGDRFGDGVLRYYRRVS